MNRSTADIARDMAATSPGTRLPCPFCGSALRSDNLAKHLDKVHAGEASDGQTRWVGEDKGSGLVLTITLTVVMIGGVSAMGLLSAGRLGAIVFAALLVVALGLVVLSLAGKIPARLVISEGTVRCRMLFGLRSREVPLQCSLEVGAATRLRSTALVPNYAAHQDHSTSHEEVRFGQYLRLHTGTRSVVVACKSGTGFRSHWAPTTWKQGAKRKTWDITLSRQSFIALEYHLAASGLLQPADGEHA